MLSADEMMIKAWRELGFYYDVVESPSQSHWRFYGSKSGLMNFVQLLTDYMSNPVNNAISEHSHYGPYSCLKVITWDKPIIHPQYIAGSIEDLGKFRDLLAGKLERAREGDSFTIDKDYSLENQADASFFVMGDGFDPVSMDKNYSL